MALKRPHKLLTPTTGSLCPARLFSSLSLQPTVETVLLCQELEENTNIINSPGMVMNTYSQAPKRLRQEDWEFRPAWLYGNKILSYINKDCHRWGQKMLGSLKQKVRAAQIWRCNHGLSINFLGSRSHICKEREQSSGSELLWGLFELNMRGSWDCIQ